MSGWVAVVVVLAVVLVGLALSVRIGQQYEKGVLFRLGRVVGVREPGLTLIIPLVEVLRRVSLRIVTMPIQSQGIITHDNVSVDVSAPRAASADRGHCAELAYRQGARLSSVRVPRR